MTEAPISDTDESRADAQATRRHLLQTAAGIGVGSLLGVGRGEATTTSGGDELWRFTTGNLVWSSPTGVDGTVFVGGFDGNVYALDAGVEGSSECSRTSLGTLGHHDGLVTADEGIDIEDTADEQLPGFGAGSALAGIGGAGYLLKRRFDEADE